jgi:hypothetical protein
MKNSILNKILSGLSDKNIHFGDLRKNLISLGFTERIKSSHHIFTKENVAEIINVQPLNDGKAKAYQVKQVRNILLKYGLHKGV